MLPTCHANSARCAAAQAEIVTTKSKSTACSRRPEGSPCINRVTHLYARFISHVSHHLGEGPEPLARTPVLRRAMNLAVLALLFVESDGRNVSLDRTSEESELTVRQDPLQTDILFLKHASRILRQSPSPVCGSRKSQTSSPWSKQHRA